MNPTDELHRLTSLFADHDNLFLAVEHVPASLTPEPYKRLLVHEHHMTVTMEQFHGCTVEVEVLNEHREGEIYSREILLRRKDNASPVQYGIVRFDFQYVTPIVREEILSREIPLGRVLITHNVLRHIDLGAILKLTAGPGLAKALDIPEGTVTYGRLATIFCNHRPAVDLLEVSIPLAAEHLPDA